VYVVNELSKIMSKYVHLENLSFFYSNMPNVYETGSELLET